MLQFFLNPLLLVGIAGIALPVIAHLLSRRRFDVVAWGAMQFLNPSRRTRRRIRIEELLLLLIRMLAVLLIALAVARPWISSGFLTGYISAGSRDVVLIIDGSNSMARSDGLTSLHQQAVRRAAEFIETLRSGDTVSVIDARDQPIVLLDPAVTEFSVAESALQELPPAAGAADLLKSCERAAGILARGTNAEREIIVFTDRQRVGWVPDQDDLWARLDEFLKLPAVSPQLWVFNTAERLAPVQQNISVGRIQLSRDLTVPDFPVDCQVALSNSGQANADVPVRVLINGQRVAGLDSTVSVPANSEVTVHRSLRFTTPGTSVVTVVADVADEVLKVDDQSHAAIRVHKAIPVLLVEDSKSLTASDGNAFFAQLALTSPENQSPWISARTVKSWNLKEEDFDEALVLVLPDVVSLPAELHEQIAEFVAGGRGLFIALGPSTTVESFQELYSETGLLPSVQLNRIRRADPKAAVADTLAPYSINSPWLERFRERRGASLLTAPFQAWWQLDFIEDREAASSVSAPSVVAELSSGDPILLQTRNGTGTILMITSSLDAEWNSLPATPDYVPFLHEALFHLAASRTQRNVDFGQPLQTRLSALPDRELHMAGPFDQTFDVQMTTTDREANIVLPRSRLPGLHELLPMGNNAEAIDRFVVNYNHEEDDPQELSEGDRRKLGRNGRITFVNSLRELRQNMYGDESRSELWAALLFLFLGIVMVEVWMTRRLVMRGHAGTETIAS